MSPSRRRYLVLHRDEASQTDLLKIDRERLTGVVRVWVRDSGWGFIHSGDDLKVFVDENAVRPDDRPLRVGEEVTFDLTQGKRGPRAVNVQVIRQR